MHVTPFLLSHLSPAFSLGSRHKLSKCPSFLRQSAPSNPPPEILPYPPQHVLTQNINAHNEAVRHSEETFYGYYPDGFTEFDLDNVLTPSLWTSYALDPHRDPTNNSPSTSTTLDIWQALTQLDERIIPPPFTHTDLARVSLTPILSPFECSEIIQECENHHWGWSSSNERYGTPIHRIGHMLPLQDLSRSYSLVNFELLPRLFPSLSTAFSQTFHPEHLRLGVCRVVKYDASDGHVELGWHRDGLLVTANIALNDIDDYDGGGTLIDTMASPIRIPKGHCLLHPGDVKHAGAPITRGVRHVLVCFLLDSSVVPHEKYCHDRMKRNVEAARLIPREDGERRAEREGLLEEAARDCADAFEFGRRAVGGACDGYEEILRVFGNLVPRPVDAEM